MKILSITAGAANMYCGSCLRDNSLAREMMAQGHEVILMPLYTPTRTDSANVSQSRVFFGGISIYLQQNIRFFQDSPKWLDWLWDRPSVIRFFSSRGISVEPDALGAMTVSMLEGREGRQRKEFDALVEWLKAEPAPDLTTIPFTLLIGLARPIREATGRPVICTLQGEELFIEGLPAKWRLRALDLIRSKVRDVDAFVAVSAYTADRMSEYLEIPRSKIHVARLGIDLEGHRERPARDSGPLKIGYLGRIAPEKGLQLLASAYIELRRSADFPGLRLDAAGYIAPEYHEYLDRIRRDLVEAGCADGFHYHGELTREQKIRFLETADVFSLPCTYDEPKGIPVLEALASGVPVVQPRRGSFPEMLNATGGGLLVEPDSPEDLARGLRALLEDPRMALQLGRQGREAVIRDYSLARSAQSTLAVYEDIAMRGRGVGTL